MVHVEKKPWFLKDDLQLSTACISLFKAMDLRLPGVLLGGTL
jgi:hypothetical protein